MARLFEDPEAVRRLARTVADAQFERMPALRARYGSAGHQHCIDDNVFHLTYLAEAVDFDSAPLFADYVAWAKVMLASRGVEGADLLANLGEIRRALAGEEDRETADAAGSILDEIMGRFDSMPDTPRSFVDETDAFGPAARAFLDSIREGRRGEADAVVREAVQRGATIEDIYLGIFEPVQHEIGRLWQMNQLTVAQEHFCTAAIQRSMSQLYGDLFSGVPGRRRVVAACAGGEMHEIGLRMVTDLLEANGWDTVYLGANVPAASLVRTVTDTPTALVAISATITPHLRTLASIVALLRATPATAHLPIIVGGYPFRLSSSIVRKIGADGWAANGAEAVRRANELVPRE